MSMLNKEKSISSTGAWIFIEIQLIEKSESTSQLKMIKGKYPPSLYYMY